MRTRKRNKSWKNKKERALDDALTAERERNTFMPGGKRVRLGNQLKDHRNEERKRTMEKLNEDLRGEG